MAGFVRVLVVDSLTWKNRRQKYISYCYECASKLYFYEIGMENCIINQLCVNKQFPGCSEKLLILKDVLSLADISTYKTTSASSVTDKD